MNNAVMYVLVILSLVLLGAHFMRCGQLADVFGALMLIALLAVKRQWVARLMQVALEKGVRHLFRKINLTPFLTSCDVSPGGR